VSSFLSKEEKNMWREKDIISMVAEEEKIFCMMQAGKQAPGALLRNT